MGELVDRLKATRGKVYRSFEVPEWGEEGKPLQVFSSPMTLEDLSKIKARSGDDETASLAYTVILKALDSQGNHLFGLEDKHFLMTQEASLVLSRVVMEINESKGFESLKKS